MSPSAARIIARPTGWCRKSRSSSISTRTGRGSGRPSRSSATAITTARCGSTATAGAAVGAVDGGDGALADGRPDAGHRPRRRPRDGRDRGRDRTRRQHQADGPLRVGRDALHPVRGRGLPPHHLLPRPARRAVALSRADGGRRGALPGPAVQRQSASPAATARTAATGPNGRIRSPSPAICSRWSPATSRANRDSFTTMSGRKVELAIWVREADLPKTAHAMDSLKAAMALGRAGLRPRI